MVAGQVLPFKNPGAVIGTVNLILLDRLEPLLAYSASAALRGGGKELFDVLHREGRG